MRRCVRSCGSVLDEVKVHGRALSPPEIRTRFRKHGGTNVSFELKAEHIELAEKLVAKMRANDGMAPVDLDRFWADQEIARKDPWAEDCPQVPLGVMMGSYCVFDELGVEEDYYRLAHDKEYTLDLHRRYNDKAEQIVGRRLLSEARPGDPEKQYPPVKALHEIFEAENRWHSESYWLMPSAHNEEEL